MKLLGLIGGVSPQSTAIYYHLLNEAARARLGGEHSANILLYALDYGVLIEHYNAGDWAAYRAAVVKGAQRLAAAGADALVITSNTTHLVAEAAGEATGLPVVHVMDALTAAMNAAGSRKPLLLGTPFVMNGDFYRAELSKRYDGTLIVPTMTEQADVGRIILDELVNGDVRDASRARLLDIIAAHDIDGVILGCTELCMILSQSDFDPPAFDTTALHAAASNAFVFGEA